MGMRPVELTDERGLVNALRGRRESLDIRQQQFDDIVGWPDGYLAKLEAPERRYGRRVLWGLSAFLFYWLDGLGLTLLLVTKEQARAIINASEEPELVHSEPGIYPNRQRSREVIRDRRLRVGYSWRGLGRRAA